MKEEIYDKVIFVVVGKKELDLIARALSLLRQTTHLTVYVRDHFRLSCS